MDGKERVRFHAVNVNPAIVGQGAYYKTSHISEALNETDVFQHDAELIFGIQKVSNTWPNHDLHAQ